MRVIAARPSGSRRRPPSACLALACLLLSTPVSLAAPPTLHVDRRAGGSTLITGDYRLDARGVRPDDASVPFLPWSEVTRFTVLQPTVTDGGGERVRLTNGDELVGRVARADQERLTVMSLADGGWTGVEVPTEYVKSVSFNDPARTEDPGHARAVRPPAEGADRFRLANGDRLSGEFDSLDADFLTLRENGKPLRVPRSRVAEATFDPALTSVPPDPAERWLLTLRDGSRLTVTGLEQLGVRVRVAWVIGPSLEFPVGWIAGCRRYDPACRPLDLASARIEVRPYLGDPLATGTEPAIESTPCTVEGRTLPACWVVRGGSEIRLPVPKGATRLQIVAALLETPAPEAGADCRVLVDDRPAAPTVALTPGGRTATFDRLDVSGAREVRLVVDSGRFGDVGDLVAWGDGVFLFAAP